MYSLIICDDKKEQTNLIEMYINNYGKRYNIKFNISIYNSGEELLQNCTDKQDIFILDIHMYKMSGIDVAKNIRQRDDKCKIIFLTALDSFWKEGYEVNAFRYLIKPISENELNKVMDSVIRDFNKNKKSIVVYEEDRIVNLPISEIYYLEIVGRKVAIYTESKTYYSKKSMSELINKLGTNGFSLSHKSFLINLNYVKEISKDNVILTNDKEVHISRRKHKEFRSELFKYIGEIL